MSKILYVVESSIRHVVFAGSEDEAQMLAQRHLADEGAQALIDVRPLAKDAQALRIINEWSGCVPYSNYGDNQEELTVDQLAYPQ